MTCRISFTIIGLIIIFSDITAAETIYLKSGRTIVASIVEQANDHIKVNFNGVAITYYTDEIQKIESPKANILPAKLPQTGQSNSQPNISDLIEKVSQAVVIIEATKENKRTQGTGFFISADGLIATNLHVVFKANSILVRTKSKKTYPAELIANYSEDLDLCLLKVNATDAVALPLGNSNELKPGQIVFTIGHREGSYYQVSSGPYVGKRIIDGEENLQSRIITGHGNSGGPLLDQNGTIIGISKAYSPDIGHNFSIPINAAKKFFNYNSLISVEDFNKQISPANQLTYDGQGLFLAGQYDQALHFFQQALALDPNYLKARISCAKTYLAKGMENDAFNAWQEVYQRDPKNACAHIHLGKIYLNRNMVTEAISHLENAARLAPETKEIYNDLGFAYGHNDMFVQAIDAYKKAVELDPQDASSQYNLAVAYFDTRNFSLAKASCEKAIALGYNVPDSFLSQLSQRQEFDSIFKVK